MLQHSKVHSNVEHSFMHYYVYIFALQDDGVDKLILLTEIRIDSRFSVDVNKTQGKNRKLIMPCRKWMF